MLKNTVVICTFLFAAATAPAYAADEYKTWAADVKTNSMSNIRTYKTNLGALTAPTLDKNVYTSGFFDAAASLIKKSFEDVMEAGKKIEEFATTSGNTLNGTCFSKMEDLNTFAHREIKKFTDCVSPFNDNFKALNFNKDKLELDKFIDDEQKKSHFVDVPIDDATKSLKQISEMQASESEVFLKVMMLSVRAKGGDKFSWQAKYSECASEKSKIFDIKNNADGVLDSCGVPK